MTKNNFWKGKKVFLTGHTGFKGSWLSIWLNSLGASITGYALKPPTEPNLFNLCKISKIVKSIIADIRDRDRLAKELLKAMPDIVIHMAAQPLVRESYKNPHETYETNVMGTVNLFEAVRKCRSVRVVLNVTTDKCYENKESLNPCRENEPLGGYDPYSSSKACSELVTSAYRNSFFNAKEYKNHHVAIATARAGNVMGGGDWAQDRLIPDVIRAALNRKKVLIRNPKAVRPWQHVLEPLRGYMLLCQNLYEKGLKYGQAWNFGPAGYELKNVEWVTSEICKGFGNGVSFKIDRSSHPHESYYLRLDSSKAIKKLGWRPVWTIKQAIDKTMEWTLAYKRGEDMMKICLHQIHEYRKYMDENKPETLKWK